MPERPPRPSLATLNRHILPTMTPYELRPYVDAAYQVAVSEIKSQNGHFHEVALRHDLAKLVQTYWAHHRRRHGTAGPALKEELLKLHTSLMPASAQLRLLTDDAQQFLRNNNLDMLPLYIHNTIAALDNTIGASAKKGSPVNAHVDFVSLRLIEIWEHACKTTFQKNLDTHHDEFLGFGPRFVQLVVGAIDPDIKLRSLITALMKVPVPRNAIQKKRASAPI